MNVFELRILDFIQEHFQCAFLDWLMPVVTKFGDGGVFWIIIAVILVMTKKYRKVGVMMGVSLISGLIFGNILLKNIVGRVRPYDMPGVDVELLVDSLRDKSFPSGHALACFEGATVLMMNDKKLGIPALLIAVAVALSRLYLYVHYPTDVLAGMIMGISFGIASYFIVNKIISIYSKNKLKDKR